MRTLLTVAVALGGAALVLAAPRPGAPTPEKPRAGSADESARFAEQLVGVVNQVSEGYYKPVPREDLMHAALLGLYRAARHTPPADLTARVRDAYKETGPALVRTAARSDVVPGEAMGAVKLVRKVRDELGDAEALRGQNTLTICCHALARTLDPHSGVVSAEEQRKAVGLDQDCEGFGLELADREGGAVTLEGVQPGSPAQRAGLRPGDRLVKVNGKAPGAAHPLGLLALRNRAAADTFLNLAGPQAQAGPAPPAAPLPTTVDVVWAREGLEGERKATLRRTRFRPETVAGVRRRADNSWEFYPDPKKKVAHVRVSGLSRGTGEELREVVSRLEEDGMTGLVLDLRWCPGGYLNEAVEVADLFLGEGVIATVTARGKEQSVYRSAAQGKPRRVALVVLVNGRTSGGGELIAAALQDHGRAVVAGQRTLGKASVQTPLHLGLPGVGMKLTSGTFVRPGGKNLHRFPESTGDDDWGVRPDDGAEFRVSADLAARLEKWWQWQTLRPGSSWERLPLDEPRADPQQRAALEVLARGKP